MWKEFKEFATKGNVVDLAIGVIIGGGFQSIVKSLVNDVIMPVISIFTGKIDFNDMMITIGNTSIKYGSFITNTKGINKKLEKKHKFFKNKKKKEESIPTPTTKVCPFCLSEINIKATRCSFCTSNLEEPKEE